MSRVNGAGPPVIPADSLVPVDPSDPSDLEAKLRAGLDPVATVTDRLPARPGVTVPWSDWVAASLRESLVASGISEPWQHQMEAAGLIMDGVGTVIATGTASGKTLSYLVPALTGVLEAQRTVLYVTPTKSLARDQLRSINNLDVRGIHAATYDGDTPMDSRRWVRQNANYILTNPEMLHHSILPNHELWRTFLRRLGYIIVDEAHHYRGVLGSHIAALIRRIRRVAEHYGSSPTCVAASATMSDPATTASRLFGVPMQAVDRDTSRRGQISILLADPSRSSGGDAGDARDSGEIGATEIGDPETWEPPSGISLVADCLSVSTMAGASALGFIRARKGAEAVALAVKSRVPGRLAQKVRAYRGGLLPEERRAVEAGLASGALLTVATTNALELGVDISGLDVVVICGWPGTRSSFLQQVGRCGRDGQDAIAVFIADDNPLDRYLVRHPDRLLRDPLEAVTLDPDNPHVLLPHLAAAIAELPMTDDAAAWFGPSAEHLVELLVRKGWVRQRAAGWFWTARSSAVDLVDMRGSGRGPVSIAEAGTGRLLGTVDDSSAPAQVHPGAVYRHQGVTYLIETLDLAASVAQARRADPPYSTTAKSDLDLRLLTESGSRELGCGRVAFGEVEVTSQVVGFIRRSLTGEFLGMEPLDMPRGQLRTKAVLWTLPVDALAAAGLDGTRIPGALHAAEHAAIAMLPGLASADRWDLGGLSTALHPDTDEPTVFVYDGHPGGAGISEHGFRNIRQWLDLTREAIATCGCEQGCPGCVQSPKCGNGNEPLDKAGALVILDLLLDGG